MIIDDIDFGVLYKAHLSLGQRRHKTAGDWDSKSDRMAMDLGGMTDPYVKEFIDKMDLTDAQTLLDVGCGPGTICLPVAHRFKAVFGLDYSLGMLQRFQEVAQQKGIHHAQCIHKAWEDDWGDVPECDIVVVSRATMVQDLEQAIEKLNNKAKMRVYTTHGVDGHFISEMILNAIGRQSQGMPNYIYAVNILQKMGYRPYVDYIDTPLNKPQPRTFEELLLSVEWSLGELNGDEQARLRHYFEEQTAKSLPVMKTSRAWAFVWWDVTLKHSQK